jgi:hypothetical protein
MFVLCHVMYSELFLRKLSQKTWLATELGAKPGRDISFATMIAQSV